MLKNSSFTYLALFMCIQFVHAQEQKCTVKNLNLNSKYQDFDLVNYSDSTVIFSSTRRQKTLRQPNWIGNGQPYLELYSAKKNKEGAFTSIEKFSKTINTKFHDADIAFSKDLKTIYFSRSNYFNKNYVKDTLGRNLIQLYKAVKGDNGEWFEKELPFNSKNYQTGHPTLNADETKLYFISDMPGGYGKTDVYVVDIYLDGTYGTPRNLGPKVNTKGREMFPVLWGNDDLYFSSDGFIHGQGGLDIFSVKLKEDIPEAAAYNLPRPINSYSDDFSISFNTNRNNGYFSSNRQGGKGDDDIYSFECSCEQYVKGITYEDVKKLDSIKAMEFYYHDDMKRIRDSINGTATKSTVSIANNTIIEQDTQTAIDSIFNATGGITILPNTKVILSDGNGQKIDSVISNDKGEYIFTINCLDSLQLSAMKVNYTTETAQVSSTAQNADTLFVDFRLKEKDIFMKGNEHILNIDPFYFDFDRADVSTQSVIGVLTIVDILRKYPSLHIEINSHTDSRGTEAYNIQLSNRRSAVMKQWIVGRGINATRITTNGYGESKPINHCKDGVPCTEEEHAKNRRSEFVITKFNTSQ
jgi:outer membrane protein OmpA-like peptidoglycan-associated protein